MTELKYALMPFQKPHMPTFNDKNQRLSILLQLVRSLFMVVFIHRSILFIVIKVVIYTFEY